MNQLKNSSSKILINSCTIILIDQLSKLLLLNILPIGGSINIIPNLLSITLVKNTGAAFSLFSNSIVLLTIISILASLILITIIIKYPPKSQSNLIGIIFLLGGTAGNGLDRLFKGYVLDFIELDFIHFPIFNFADICINVAIICFLLDLLRTSYYSKQSIKK